MASTPSGHQLARTRPISVLDMGVIRDARRRQRRRRLAITAAVAASALLVTLAWIVSGGGSPLHLRSASPFNVGAGVFESPSVAFAQAPYMGVACHRANVIACDRVGLAVWLRREAAVTATIAGVPLRLNNRRWSWVARDGRNTQYVYAGFLQPAGLTTTLRVPASPTATWFGQDAPSPLVRFRIDYGHGVVVRTQVRVVLSAGWG